MGNSIGVLKDSIQNELLSSIFDLSQDYAEIGIDKLLDNAAFKEMPVVKTIVSLSKGALAIREIVVARKLIVFLQQFHKGLHSQSDVDKMIKNLVSDSGKRDRIIEQIIIMNERYIESKQSVVHANLLLAYLKSRLTWNELSDLLICLDALHPRSMDYLEQLEKQNFVFLPALSSSWVGSLIAVGLTLQKGPHKINELGRKLYYYGVKGDFNAVIPPIEATSMDRLTPSN
ncbi:hypothetical protein HDF19_08465 [Mucilaginibacter sp. E4BP6]|uniref:hypothetical protein n=1 Tax=Mucilaginibacter sp. E4BP6 TaxID=2723089 RepID=UPI0015CE4256|nr:hypothetical protein [Mucilaginibacter sp. E4BP6]NYE68618.1 hypothetical protein [Mucilaginibacter sp. E4BP6]